MNTAIIITLIICGSIIILGLATMIKEVHLSKYKMAAENLNKLEK